MIYFGRKSKNRKKKTLRYETRLFFFYTLQDKQIEPSLLITLGLIHVKYLKQRVQQNKILFFIVVSLTKCYGFALTISTHTI